MRHVLMAACGAALALSSAWADRVKPVNLDKVNTEKDEDEPHSTVSANGVGQLFYASGGELRVLPRTVKGWQPSRPFAELQDRGEIRSVFVHFHKSGAAYPQTIFYATNGDADKPDGRGDNFDLYSMVRNSATGADFTVPSPILSVCTPADELHPWLTADGKLYFSRKTKEGWRVFVAQRAKADQPFGKPAVVELPVGFHHATLSPDGHTMYLQGPLDKGRSGLFRSTQVSGKWIEPEELKDLNSADAPTGDRSPNLSRNAATLYFVSDRSGGKGGLDIWYVATSELKKK
jgi:hypothetical protein